MHRKKAPATEAIVMRPATPKDATSLSALAFRAKGHWGYSDAFMEACRDELTIDSVDLAGDRATYVIAELAGSLVGFYALEPLPNQSAELDALFVEPAYLRRGVGRELLRHAVAGLSARGIQRLVIYSDPHAAGFYIAAGAEHVGETESGSIPGRMLPLLHLAIGPSRTSP